MRRRLFIAQLTLIALAGTRFARLAVANWKNEDFSNGDFQDKWQTITSGKTVIDSQEIIISLPQIAENGAVVPINIRSELDHIDKLYVLVEKNPTPLAAVFTLSPAVGVYATARIKMAESCNVVVLARQGERWLRSQQWVQVMVGGCGTG